MHLQKLFQPNNQNSTIPQHLLFLCEHRRIEISALVGALVFRVTVTQTDVSSAVA